MAKLFKDITELKKFISVTASYKISEFETRIDFAIETYLKPWIGKSQLDATIIMHANSTGTPLQLEFVKKLQMCLAHFVFYEHIPFAQVVIDDSGITRKENEHYKTAYANQVQMLMDSTLRTAYDTLEQTLTFLEENEGAFLLWKNGTTYTKNREFFINTSTDFANQYPIIRGRQTFRSLFPIMNDIETFYIYQLLGKLFYNELKTKIKAKTPFSAEEQILVGYIKKAIAYLSISKGVKNNWVKYSPHGVISLEHSAASNNQIEKSATNTQETLKIRETQETGELYVTRIKDYLKNNIDSFPTFKSDVSVNTVVIEQIYNSDSLDGIFYV